MEIPLHHGCSCRRRHKSTILVGLFALLLLDLILFANCSDEKRKNLKFLNNHMKKRNIFNHRLERQPGFPSLYQTYRYDQDVNIGILVNLHHDVNYSSNDSSDKDNRDDTSLNKNTENIDEEKTQNAIFQRKGSLITHRKNAGMRIPSAESKHCGPINLEAVQQVLAANGQ